MAKLRSLHYGWVIVFAAIVAITTYGIGFYSFGIFLLPLTTEFGWERGALSTAVSINMLTQALLALISGKLTDKYGPRVLVTITGVLAGLGFILLSRVEALWHVYLAWGVILGIAASCLFTPLIASVPRWFVKRRGMAVGLGGIGFGLGGIISPLFTQWLITTYNWRLAFLILGILLIGSITPVAQLLKHSPQRVGLRPYGDDSDSGNKSARNHHLEGFTFKEALKTGDFWIIGFMQFCFFFCLQVVLVHTVPYARDTGISPEVGAVALSIMGGVSVASRMVMGFVCDRIGSKPGMTLSLLFIAVAMVLLLLAGTPWAFYLFALIFGIGYGGITLVQSLLPTELFGLSSLGIILAGLIVFGMIGSASGPPVAGTIFDERGSYELALFICIALAVLAVIGSLFLFRSRSKVSREIKAQ